ncbi:MAG: retroviral-like aspartic protease family protein [Bacteroidales bacterium]|nr:retroviral-like aspartic protease family protein [Bacteroidales bacterium]
MKFIILNVLLTLLSGCISFKTYKLVNDGNFVNNSFQSSTIPFTLKGDHIIIKARINNSKEYLFFLDTGALTMVSQKVALELKLQKEVDFDVTGTSGDTKSIDLIKLNKIALGNMEVMNCSAMVNDLPAVLPNNYAGLLGSNFLRHFIVTIDYKNKNITLSRKDNISIIDNAGIKLPFKTNMRWGFAPEIKCNIDGTIKNSALIDTGSSKFLSLPLSMLKTTHLFQRGGLINSKGGMSGGVFGMDKESFIFRIDELKIGGATFNNIPAESYSADMGPILLGNKFLEKFLVILDYPAEEMTLIPNGMPFETNITSYGMSIFKVAEKTIVTGIWNNSSADRAGIQPGNEVFMINGIDVGTLSLYEIRDIIMDEDAKPIEVEFTNDKGRQKSTLHKDELLPAL